MERIITFCVLIFYLGLVASLPFAYPEGNNLAHGQPRSQYQQYHTVAQPQPLYTSVDKSPAQAFIGNAYNVGNPNTHQLPNTVQNTQFINSPQRQSYQNVLTSPLPSPQQIQKQITAGVIEQQAKPSIQKLEVAPVKGPAPNWQQAVATTGVQQQQIALSSEAVNPYAQIYRHVIQRPQQNYDQQFLQSWKQLFQNQQQAPKTLQKKPLLVIRPDGRTEYFDNLESIKKIYPNFVLVNGGQSPTSNTPQTKPISSQPNVKHQPVLTVPLQQQSQTSGPVPQAQQGPQEPIFNIPKPIPQTTGPIQQPPQTPQKPVLSNLKSTPKTIQQTYPDYPKSGSHVSNGRQKGQQAQPSSVIQPTNIAPLGSLILSSTSTQPVQQSAAKGEQLARANSFQPQNGPTNQPDRPVILNQPSDAVDQKRPQVTKTRDESQPQLKLELQTQPQISVQYRRTQPQSSNTQDQKESQPSNLNGQTLPQSLNLEEQTQPKTSDTRRKTQSQSSKPEDQTQPQTSDTIDQPKSSLLEDKSSSLASQSQPESIDQVKNQESKDNQDNQDDQSQPSEQTDQSNSESGNTDSQSHVQSINPKEQAQLNKSDNEPEPVRSSNQTTDPTDETLPSNLNGPQDSQPADTTQPEHINQTEENEPPSSGKQIQPTDNQDDSVPQDKNNSHSPRRKLNASSQTTPSDYCSENESETLNEETNKNPGKIVVIDTTEMKSGELPDIDSELLSKLFGDNPYSVFEIFMVKPERTVERNVTRTYFGDHDILEEITISERYGDDEPVVTSETHFIPASES